MQSSSQLIFKSVTYFFFVRIIFKLKVSISRFPIISLTGPSVQIESLATYFNKNTSKPEFTLKQRIYERAIGQHLYKSPTAHGDPCRYGDFEVNGRTSDF